MNKLTEHTIKHIEEELAYGYAIIPYLLKITEYWSEDNNILLRHPTINDTEYWERNLNFLLLVLEADSTEPPAHQENNHA